MHSRTSLLLLAVVAGCGADRTLCTMGEVSPCTCPDGEQSVQQCTTIGLPGICQCQAADRSDGGLRDAQPVTPGSAVTTDKPGDAGTDPPSGSCTASSLTFRPLDVEYARSIDRIVAVTANPDALVVLDPATNNAVTVPLPLTPAAVSVGPDGKTAAVGHDAFVSIVDLVAGSVRDTIPITSDTADIVLAGNGFAYVFPRTDQWVDIHSVDIARRVDHGRAGHWSIYDDSRARLHPAGTSIYTVDRGISPTDIQRIDISAKVAVAGEDSPYHGDFPMCDGLWFTQGGDRLLTGCGTAFRTSPGAADDMTYAGTLGGVTGTTPRGVAATRFHWVDHSAANRRLYAIPSGVPFGSPEGAAAHAETQVRVYTDDYLSLETALDIPCVATPTGNQRVYGRYAFVTDSGKQLYVLGQQAPESGAALDWTISAITL